MSFKEEVIRRGIRVEISFHQAVLGGYVEDIKHVVFILESDVEKTWGYDPKSTLFIPCKDMGILRQRLRYTADYMKELGLDYAIEHTYYRIVLQ